PAASRARLGGAARGRDRLPLARHQHHQYQAHRLRHRCGVRRLRRLVLCRPPGLHQPGVLHLHGERHRAVHRGDGVPAPPARCRARRFRYDRRNRDPARARLAQAGVRRRFRADAVSHAVVWTRHGALDDLEAARSHLVPSALHLSARAPHGPRGSGAGGARLMVGTAMMPLLTVEHLTMRFGGLVAIADLSFVANKGEITAIIGPNGAGKTTVFNCITGFYKPTGGRLVLSLGGAAMPADVMALTGSGRRFRNTAAGTVFLLERMPDHEIAARARVARTFQNIRLFPGMTVLENLIVAQHNALMAASGWTVLGLLGAKRYVAAEAAAVERAK